MQDHNSKRFKNPHIFNEMKEMNYFYIIAFATLGGTIGLAAFVIGFQGAYLSPLAEEERESYLAMDCDELKEYTAKGVYWSPQNSKEARTLVAGCK